ncbi:MAG: LysR family transcriptional regulator [Eggerthellaceae bacterium]|jgi:DNA-binding transcriptional LysR family regulator
MNLSQLYYYRMLTRVRNYKKAAAELYISEPTLSVAIKKLETELGTELLQRKRHTIELTPDGEEFSECVNEVLQNLDSHVNAIKQRSQQRSSMLRIGIVLSAEQRIWANMLDEFRAHEGYANVRMLIQQDTTEHLVQALKDDEVDVIITGPLDADDALVSSPAWSVTVLAAINKNDPLAAQESVSFDDLRSRHLISYERDTPLGLETKHLADDFDLDVDCAFKNEPSLCSNVAEDEHTIALVCNSWMAYANPHVALVPISDAPRNYHRFWISHHAVLPKGDTMLNRFMEFANAYDYDKLPTEPPIARSE